MHRSQSHLVRNTQLRVYAEEIVKNLRKKFPRTASTGIGKTRLASGTVRFADLLLKIDGTCSRGHDTPAKTSNNTRHIYNQL